MQETVKKFPEFFDIDYLVRNEFLPPERRVTSQTD
jgi:hypothetical protein